MDARILGREIRSKKGMIYVCGRQKKGNKNRKMRRTINKRKKKKEVERLKNEKYGWKRMRKRNENKSGQYVGARIMAIKVEGEKEEENKVERGRGRIKIGGKE